MSTPVEIRIAGAEGTEEKKYAGKHIEKDGVHYLFYHGENGACRITLYPDRAEIRRDGEPLPLLSVVRGEFTEAVLSQKFGELSFRVKGREILRRFSGEEMRFELSYSLWQGERTVADNLVRITVRPSGEQENS